MKFSLKIISFLIPFWAGLISAISFLEAWLKFKAEGVTLEIGLSIGSLVFTVLNRIEIIILVIIWILLIAKYKKQLSALMYQNVALGIVSVILLLQTFWLLPDLLYRANSIISGNEPIGSFSHVLFILFEVIKLAILISLSFKFLKKNEKTAPKI